MTDEYDDDDDGFLDYVVTTIDPAPGMLIATAVFSFTLYAILPLLVAMCNRRDRQRAKQKLEGDGEGEQIVCQLPRDFGLQGGGGGARENASMADGSVASYASSLIGPVLDAAHRTAGRLNRNHRAGRRTSRAIRAREANLDARDGAVAQQLANEPASSAFLEKDDVSSSVQMNNGDEAFHASGDERVSKKEAVAFAKSPFGTWFDKLLSIAEWDQETRRIYKLALPFFSQALLEGVAEAANVAIIGQLIGTKEMAAYVVTDLLIGISNDALEGFQESLTQLLSHSIGTGNRKLTGEFLQLAAIFYVVLSIPFIVMWYYVIEDAILWLGFDDETAKIGRSFAIPMMFSLLLDGVTDVIHALLDVTDREVLSSVLVAIGEIVATLTLLVLALVFNPTLETVGYMFLVISAIYLVSTITLFLATGWYRRYYCGLFGSFALKNWTAVKLMLRTSTALTAGYIVAYSEWEVLTFFASFLGPAEVTAWSILGTLWDILEEITESMADASEVRVGLLLGQGQPRQAKKSAYKSIFIAFTFALFSTSVLFILGTDIPTWMTTDPTLQNLVAELIPLFGIGNIALTMGTMAWTIVGAQGRYRLATAIGCAGSWLVTIPLAAIFSIAFRINLQGQTAAVVIGYMVSGMVTNAILLRSDWSKLSRKVIEDNKEITNEQDDDSECSDNRSTSQSSGVIGGQEIRSGDSPGDAET